MPHPVKTEKTEKTDRIDDRINTRIEQIRQTEQTVADRHPALADVIRPFAGLFRAKAALAERLKTQEEIQTDSNIPPALQLEAFPATAASLAAREILIAVKENFPALTQAFDLIEAKLEEIDFSTLLRAYLEKGADAVAAEADKQDLPTDCLEMVTRLSASVLLEAMFSDCRLPEKDAQTHCPVCGSLPAMSFLGRVPEDQSEFLTGGGGIKYLHCGLCGHDFKTHRHLCPVCHTRDPEHLRYYQTDKESGERVDACLNCNTYLPGIDLRKAESIRDMDTAGPGLLHLEILAREKGFAPMAWTLWNRLE